MPQEDKFKREIDKIGQLLAKLMDELLHTNTSGDPFALIVRQLQAELDFDLEQWILMNDRADINYLINDKHFSLDNLRVLGDILYQLTYKSANEKSLLLKKKALILYEYITANNNGTLYYDLHYKIQELKAKS